MKYLWILILFLLANSLISTSAIAEEIKDFNMHVKIDEEKINFNFDGNLIGISSNPLFIIGQGGYFSKEYSCIIDNQKCSITPIRLDIEIGPEMHRLPNGSEVVSNPSTSHQINSPAFINIPENANGYFSIGFSLVNIINKQSKLYFSFLELDEKEEYTINQFDLLQTRTPVEIKYFLIEIPENYILSDDSRFSYYNICGSPGLCKTDLKFKKLEDNSYTLANVSYSKKPYISDLSIPPFHFINLELKIERSEEFILLYKIIALLTPFLIIFTFLINLRYRKNEHIHFITDGLSAPAIYLLLRTYYLKLEFIPLHKEDIYFAILFIILIIIIENRNRLRVKVFSCLGI